MNRMPRNASLIRKVLETRFRYTHSAHDTGTRGSVDFALRQLPMLLKPRNPVFALIAIALAVPFLSAQPSQALSSGHASSGGHSTTSKSTATEHHSVTPFRGRGHSRGWGGNYDSDQDSLPPVSNQMNQYMLKQDAARTSLPRSAFVQEYSWPSATTAPSQTQTAYKTQETVQAEGLGTQEVVAGRLRASTAYTAPPPPPVEPQSLRSSF
jgi:hypothetical protein